MCGWSIRSCWASTKINIVEFPLFIFHVYPHYLRIISHYRYFCGHTTSRWYMIRPITIGPHKCTKICWLADLQIWVHLWGPCGCVLYNDYHRNIEKADFNRSNFPFPSQSINTLVALDGTIWSCLVWLLPIRSDDYGMRTCNLNDVTVSAVGLSQTASRWKQVRTHATKRRECLFWKTPRAQIF